jgi:hypothetical protein
MQQYRHGIKNLLRESPSTYQVRAQVRLYGICGEQNNTGAGFLRVFQFIFHSFHRLLHTHGAGSIGLNRGQSTKWTEPQVEIANADKKKQKSPVSDQIVVELIQARGEILLSANHKLIKAIFNIEELQDQWKESISVIVHKEGDKTHRKNSRGISLLSTSYNISNILLSSFHHKLFVIISVGFDMTNHY